MEDCPSPSPIGQPGVHCSLKCASLGHPLPQRDALSFSSLSTATRDACTRSSAELLRAAHDHLLAPSPRSGLSFSGSSNCETLMPLSLVSSPLRAFWISSVPELTADPRPSIWHALISLPLGNSH